MVAVHLPAPDARLNAATLANYGADRVVLMEAESTVHPASARCASALAKVILVEQPYAVLFGSTANGRELASRIAANMALGLTGDCINLAINDDGELVQFKPALGGNVVAPIQSRTTPYMATLRPGLLNPIEPTPGAVHMVEVLDIPPIDTPDFEVLEVHYEEDAQGLELAGARVVMGVGNGDRRPRKSASHTRAGPIFGCRYSCNQERHRRGLASSPGAGGPDRPGDRSPALHCRRHPG